MWDLLVFANSADRSTAGRVPVAVNEDLFTSDALGRPYPKANGTIFGLGTVSETAAAVYARIHRHTDPNWMRSTHFNKIQTDAFRAPAIGRCNYPVLSDDVIDNTLNNGGAVCDALSVFISEGGIPRFWEGFRPDNPPPGAIPVTFVATMTHVADSWSPIAQVVLDDYNLKAKATYTISGLHAFSATGLAHRLRFYEGAWKGHGPGILGGDSKAVSHACFGEFGQFKGLNSVGIQTVAVAADATTSGTLWLTESGG